MTWLWRSRTPAARLARAALLPPAIVFRITASTRTAAYRSGWLRRRSLGLPSVGVGNLSVGGTGKTPVASWIARYYARRGMVPGVLLRGYGADEGDVHRRAVPEAVVVERPDRHEGARRAAARGAQVLVLDDAFQRHDAQRDLDIALVSAESYADVPWPLPAGPWREGWAALRRAGMVVVTRKTASDDAVRRTIQRVQATGADPVAVASLQPVRMTGMRTGRPVPISAVAGRQVLVSAGIAGPCEFAEQLRRQGAAVRLMAWRDHRRYVEGDIADMLRAATEVDYVVVTAKDASKLRGLWPPERPEPLVAELGVAWERGGRDVEDALARVVGAGHMDFSPRGNPAGPVEAAPTIR